MRTIAIDVKYDINPTDGKIAFLQDAGDLLRLAAFQIKDRTVICECGIFFVRDGKNRKYCTNCRETRREGNNNALD